MAQRGDEIILNIEHDKGRLHGERNRFVCPARILHQSQSDRHEVVAPCTCTVPLLHRIQLVVAQGSIGRPTFSDEIDGKNGA